MKTFDYTTSVKALPGDIHTPVTTYMKVRDIFPQSALMESSDYHGGENGRSFIGLDPIAKVSVNHGYATATYPDGTEETTKLNETDNRIENAISNFMNHFEISGEDANYCGLYGFTSFNVVRYTENIKIKDSTASMNDAPDLLYILYRYIIVFKGFRHEMEIVTLKGDGKDETSKIAEAINSNQMRIYPFRSVGQTTSPLTDDEHRANIRKGIKHCLRGDVFQVVISRRFEQHYEGDDFNLYRALRRINPSPYLFYFDFGAFRIFGSSPETHYRVEGKAAYIDPIAGTTRRSGDKATDDALTKALLDNPKENAEHVMLVDLARNDMGRISEFGTVKVTQFMEVQNYSHVMHIVSMVEGRKKGEFHLLDLVSSFLPAGTLSGAPKIRAMEIIDELESVRRGLYGGATGYIDYSGDMDFCITIRTMIKKGKRVYLQAGAGIVADSIPENEYQECCNKVMALAKTLLHYIH